MEKRTAKFLTENFIFKSSLVESNVTNLIFPVETDYFIQILLNLLGLGEAVKQNQEVIFCSLQQFKGSFLYTKIQMFQSQNIYHLS